MDLAYFQVLLQFSSLISTENSCSQVSLNVCKEAIQTEDGTLYNMLIDIIVFSRNSALSTDETSKVVLCAPQQAEVKTLWTEEGSKSVHLPRIHFFKLCTKIKCVVHTSLLGHKHPY